MGGSNPGGHTFCRTRSRATFPPGDASHEEGARHPGSGRSSARGPRDQGEAAQGGAARCAASRRVGRVALQLSPREGRRGGHPSRRVTTEPPPGATRRPTRAQRGDAAPPRALCPPLRSRRNANRPPPRLHLARHQPRHNQRRQPRVETPLALRLVGVLSPAGSNPKFGRIS